MVSIATTNNKQPQAGFFLNHFFTSQTRALFVQERLLHFSNLQTLQCKKVTLRKWSQALFSITTSPFNTCILHTASSINSYRAARGRVKCAYSRPARAQKFCADEGLACILLYVFPSFVEWQKAKATRKERSRQQQEDVMTS